MIFHVGIMGMAFVDYEIYGEFYHYAGMYTIGAIFFGAVHEVVTLVFGLIYDIFSCIKRKITKNNWNKNKVSDG